MPKAKLSDDKFAIYESFYHAKMAPRLVKEFATRPELEEAWIAIGGPANYQAAMDRTLPHGSRVLYARQKTAKGLINITDEMPTVAAGDLMLVGSFFTGDARRKCEIFRSGNELFAIHLEGKKYADHMTGDTLARFMCEILNGRSPSDVFTDPEIFSHNNINIPISD